MWLNFEFFLTDIVSLDQHNVDDGALGGVGWNGNIGNSTLVFSTSQKVDLSKINSDFVNCVSFLHIFCFE